MIAVTAPVVPARNPTTATASEITSRQYELEGEERPELVDAGMIGPADERRTQPAIGKEVADCDHGGSERHHSERGRRELVREHDRADERDHLGARRAHRQQHRANRTAIPYRGRAFRLGWLRRPPHRPAASRSTAAGVELPSEQSCAATRAIYSYYEARCARLTSRAPGPASSLKCLPEGVDVVGAKLLERQVAVEVILGGAADRLAQGVIAQQSFTLVNQSVEAARDAHKMHAGFEWHVHLSCELGSDHARTHAEILDKAVAQFTAPGKVQADLRTAHFVHVLAPPHGAGASLEAEPVLSLQE